MLSSLRLVPRFEDPTFKVVALPAGLLLKSWTKSGSGSGVGGAGVAEFEACGSCVVGPEEQPANSPQIKSAARDFVALEITSVLTVICMLSKLHSIASLEILC